jgi:hypothetical protein
MEPTEFLARHRPRMLEILRDVSPALQGNREVRRFLDLVDDDFEQVTSTPKDRDYLPGEDVFWWCHSQLWELTEIVHPPRQLDPWVRYMLDDLRDMRGRLERNEPLPDTHYIGWFDDTVPPDDEDEEAMEARMEAEIEAELRHRARVPPLRTP